MRLLSFARGISLAALAALLAACVVIEEGPGPRPPEEPRFCTREYDPVCGERFGDRRTFANPCMARQDGYRIVYGGECRRRPPQSRPPQACTMEYAPVCAVRGNDFRTFSNDCMARGSGYRVVAQGECRRGGSGTIGSPPSRPGVSPGAPGSSSGGFTNRPPRVCPPGSPPGCVPAG